MAQSKIHGFGSYTNQIQDGPTRRALYEALQYEQPRVITVRLDNPSVAKSEYVACPWNGRLGLIYAVANANHVGPSPGVASFGIEGVAVSGNTITFSTGAVAGTGVLGSVTCTSAVNKVSAGDIIRFSVDGGQTGPAMNVYFTAVINRD